MNYIHHRKLLRLSTFVAVTIGLALGSSAMAEPTTETTDSGLLANGGSDLQEEEPDGELQVDEEAQLEQEPGQQQATQQLPGSIQELIRFVNQYEEDEVENIHEFTYEGSKKMADALLDLIPDDHAQANVLEAAVNDWDERLDVLDSERPDYATLANLLFNEGAQHLTTIQDALIPGENQLVEQVGIAAQEIEPDAIIEEQVAAVQLYLNSGAAAIQDIYVSSQEEGEPMTQADVDLGEASTPPELAQVEEDDEDGLFGLGIIPGDVEEFEEFVQEHRAEGVVHVADYTRDGTELFHDAMQSLVEDQDPELIREQLSMYQERVDELDTTRREEYPEALERTLMEGTQILATIQQAYYPQFEQQVQQVFMTIEKFDTNQAIEGQVNTIQNVFIQASAATRLMAEAEQQPQALMQVQHQVETGEPGEYADEPPQDEQPHEQPKQQEGEVGAGPPVTGEVQQYIEFVETMQLRELTTEGDQKVVEGIRNLEGALSFFIEGQDQQQQPGQQEPGMEQPGEVEEIQMQEPDMEEPGMEQDHGMQAQNLQQQHQELTDQINEMEQAVGTPVFSEYLANTTQAAAELLTSIQEEQFPQLQEDVQGLTQITEQINAQDNVEEQAAQILAFFAYTGQTLQMMEEQQVTEEPAALLMSLF